MSRTSFPETIPLFSRSSRLRQLLRRALGFPLPEGQVRIEGVQGGAGLLELDPADLRPALERLPGADMEQRIVLGHLLAFRDEDALEVSRPVGEDPDLARHRPGDGRTFDHDVDGAEKRIDQGDGDDGDEKIDEAARKERGHLAEVLGDEGVLRRGFDGDDLEDLRRPGSFRRLLFPAHPPRSS